MAILTITVSLYPAIATGVTVERLRHHSNAIDARDWMITNLPPGSTIAEEWRTVPLEQTTFDVQTSNPLPLLGTIADLRANGYDYLIINAQLATYYLERSAEFPNESMFYSALAQEAQLIREFQPTATKRGTWIQIYALQ